MTVIPYTIQFRLNTHLATTMVNITIVVSFVFMWFSVLMIG
jgi:hypothetical protein